MSKPKPTSKIQFEQTAPMTSTEERRRALGREKTRRYQLRHPERILAYRKSGPGRASVRKRLKVYRSTAWGRAIQLVLSAKHRATLKRIPFDITVYDILPAVERGVCERTGISFNHTSRRNRCAGPWTSSIDRIVPELGYTRGNIAVVCWIYNEAKRHFTEKEVLTMARALIKSDKCHRKPQAGRLSDALLFPQ